MECILTYSKEIIMLISVIVIIYGWHHQAKLDRQHEISKQKFDYRLKMMSTSIPTLIKLRNTNGDTAKLFALQDEFYELHIKFQIYANKAELDLLNKIKGSEIENIDIL